MPITHTEDGDIYTGDLAAIISDTTEVLKLLSEIVASNILRHSHDVQATTNSVTYAVVKTITADLRIAGTIRIKFGLASATEPYTVYGKIYKNGVAIGTEHSITGPWGTTVSEDLNVTLNPGDQIQIYGKTSNVGIACRITNFRIYFDGMLYPLLGANT